MKKYNETILWLLCLFLLSIAIIGICANRPSQKQDKKSIDNLPLHVRQFLHEEGIDLNKLKTDPELQEKVRRMMKGRKSRSKIFEKTQKSKRFKSVESEKSRRSDKKSEDLPSIYEVIIRKNLFCPLGWTDKRPRPPFVLCRIVKSSKEKKVLIQRTGTPEGYYVGVGDMIANGYKVEEITEKKALLKKDSEEVVLKLNNWVPLGGPSRYSFVSSGAGKPSTKHDREKPGRKEPPLEFRPPPSVPPAMVIREILKKEGLTLEEVMRNPELKEKLTRKYGPMIRGLYYH